MTRRIWAWAGLLFVLAYLVTLGVRPMVTPDEPRYGAIAAEMLASGDWLSLKLAGFRYYEKPALGYWLNALAMGLFGHDAFALRLSSALAAGATALATAWFVRRATGRAEAGAVAAVVQLTMLWPFLIGTAAVLDGPFTCFVVLAIVAAFVATEEAARPRRAWLMALAGACAGLAFMTKGVLALAIPAMVVGPYLVWMRRLREVPGLLWPALLAAVAVVAPWAIAVHRAEPQFWHHFIWVEHVRRFASPDVNQHAEPWWYFLPILPLGALAWLVVLPRALSGLGRGATRERWLRYCACWVAVPLLFFSVASGKLPTYILPLYPPLAAMFAVGLLRWHAAHPAGAPRMDRLAIGLLLLAALAFAAIGAVGPASVGLPEPWGEGGRSGWFIIGLALVAWAAFEWWACREREAPSRLARHGLAMLPLLIAIPWLLPTGLLAPAKVPWELLARARDGLGSAKTIVTIESMGHAIAWETGRTDIVVVGDPSEFNNELGDPAEQARLIAWRDLPAFLREACAMGPVAVVASRAEVERAAKALGADASVESSGDLAVALFPYIAQPPKEVDEP